MTLIRRKIYLPVGITLFALIACSEPTKPALPELDSAGRGLDSARAAGAATYAPLELRFAEERLGQARTAVDKRDYAAAQLLAEEASVNSELAVVKSRLGKAREKVDAATRENARLHQEMQNNDTNRAGASQ